MFGLFSNQAANKKTAHEIAEFSLYLRHSLTPNLQDFIAAIAERGITLDESVKKEVIRRDALSFNAANMSWDYTKIADEPCIGASGYGELFGLNIQIFPVERSKQIMVNIEKPILVQMGKAKMGKSVRDIYKELLKMPDFFDLKLKVKRLMG